MCHNCTGMIVNTTYEECIFLCYCVDNLKVTKHIFRVRQVTPQIVCFLVVVFPLIKRWRIPAVHASETHNELNCPAGLWFASSVPADRSVFGQYFPFIHQHKLISCGSEFYIQNVDISLK